jgi:16S rRNA (guanine966-N2)-methyltransferase
MKRRQSAAGSAGPRHKEEPIAGVRIVGGMLRGRKLQYSGDQRTRPMKDRVREAVFNLLGPGVAGSYAIDLFAGTGALGLEAISRGAERATFIERHLPTAKLIEKNVAALGIAASAEIVFGDAFGWSATFRPAETIRLTVFCSPPYDFYTDRRKEMIELISGWIEVAPAESMIVVEADERFDFRLLPQADGWDIRSYPPAVIAIFEKPA